MKYIFLIFSLAGFLTQLSAQSETKKSQAFGAFVIFPIEFPVIDNEEFNSVLNESGFPSSDYSVANLGIGLQLYLKRWITTLSFNKTTKSSYFNDFLTEVEYRSTSFNLGYDLTKNHRYSIYPFAGLKFYGLNYLTRQKTEGEIDFNGYLNSNLEYSEINTSRANLDLGVGFSYQWFFLLNFRAGYLLPLGESRWEVNDGQNKLGNTPVLNYDYYFTLTIGLGGIYDENEVDRRYGVEE
ncbi:hypothetical protein [Brumimicrobium aurantiacum]|uniref:Outer membrane protein beta-barrel domain-containing protein n=1 Tax=Brumimicrobium aurantiacum TaxID=1737063 RepID=A0A3E1EVG7_9FLAO|nr:hypothetical protein [Brumimicrobium aurantiacum]RFC53512.1 hypothetical protein DXU93_12145 [Brumimicrobium aurantiacum]